MKPKNELQEKREYMQEFVSSSRELLDDVEPQIVALEKNAARSGVVSDEILNNIFRFFHTLKGTAGFVDLTTITSVTHEAETLLDLFRKGRGALDSNHVDLLCRTSDFVRTVMDTVENSLDESPLSETAAGIVAELRRAIAIIARKEGAAIEAPPAPVSVPEPSPAAADGDVKFELTSQMRQRFSMESLELCEEAEMMLLAFEKAPDNLDLATTAFRALHSLKGNCGFFGYDELERVSHMAESILDDIRSGEKKAEPGQISSILSAVDFIRNSVRKIGENKIMEMTSDEHYSDNQLAAGTDENEGAASDDTRDGRRTEASCVQVRPACKGRDDASYEKTGGRTAVASDGRDADPASKSAAQPAIRIGIKKLDMLLDLVGEMVISEAMIANNPALKGFQIPGLEKAVNQLDKITRDIQEVALSMRMIPIAQTFHKMERLVRDLSIRSGKKVNLTITGELTEVDKTIIEQIADPLIHLIRNSVDHGLERPEERRASGKSEEGCVRLEARHAAGEVWITVGDDGKGLDRKKILDKAVEKGLVSEETARGMKDDDVWKLIFEPGFSTAEKVSSISGRGVGMDVVKKNIEKMRGKIDIRTKAGQGSEMVLRIPLTLAIIEGMVIRVGRSRYTIPINSICESLKPEPKQITVNPDGMEIIRIRGELIPIVRLHELYDIRPDFEKIADGLLIIVESDGGKCALFADELVGQQQIVIKGLAGYLGHVRSVSGCAILGDGDISLILDIGDLIDAVEKGNRLHQDGCQTKTSAMRVRTTQGL